jgi:Flp pilus assembly protein TadG
MARNLIRTQKGITMVELAIVLPILLLVLFAIAEISIALYDKAVLTNASREGARCGIVARSRQPADIVNIEVDIRKAVKDYASAYLITFGTDKLQDDHIAIAWTDIAGGGLNFGDNLTVSVTYSYGFLVLSRLITALGINIPLNATTVMKLE